MSSVLQNQDGATIRHRRFFVALILHEIIQEEPLGRLSNRYGVSRGNLQQLQTLASSFAGMVTVFCEHLNWNQIAILLRPYQVKNSVNCFMLRLLNFILPRRGLAMVPVSNW